jgi:phosphoribosylformylglycinamidine synthase
MGGPYEDTGFGLEVDLTAYGSQLPAPELLFSESHGRAVVTCPPERATAALALAQELGVPAQRLGTVGERGGAVRFRLRDATVEHPVDRLRQVYFSSVSRRMGD